MRDCFENRRVVVTGGLGFVGSHLARRLVKAGARVTIVDSLSPHCGGRLENVADIHHRARVEILDLCYASQHPRLFEDCELLFSLAGTTSHLASMCNPLVDLKSNAESHLCLLEVLRKVAPEVHVIVGSTRQVYGRTHELPVDETCPLRPVDINGIHMQAAEEYYRLYHELYDLRSACLRLTNVYGPQMKLSATCHGVAAVFLGRALRGETINLFGGGHQRRDFNHIDDVVDAFLAAAHLTMEDHETYNLGSQSHHSLREFVGMLECFLPITVREVSFPEDLKRIDVGDYHADFSKFQAETGWQPRVDLKTGVAATLKYYTTHPEEYRTSATPLLGSLRTSHGPEDFHPSQWLQTQRR